MRTVTGWVLLWRDAHGKGISMGAYVYATFDAAYRDAIKDAHPHLKTFQIHSVSATWMI